VSVRLILVRHGKPDGRWGRDPDPGLDPHGHAQAAAVADALADLGPRPIVVSPLRRTRETAAPIERVWAVEARVDPAVGELTAPADPRPDPQTWLRSVMAATGADFPDVLGPFRSRVLGAIRSLRTDTVVVTHFLAINAVVGAATGDDRVVCFAPAHCSRTVVELAGDTLRLVELGAAGDATARL
jgi:broad specificity phosphatase PhoE